MYIEGAEGPDDAKIMFVGEAWGEAEEKTRAPFKGMAGRVLDSALEEAGITRDQCRITNVVHERPPGNNFKVYYEKQGGKLVPGAKLMEAYGRLANEIRACNSNVVVPLGAEPLRAITGRTGITDWRGSILETAYGKVIPTIHPAAVCRQWNYLPALVSDLKRVLAQADFPEVRITERMLIINPTFKEVMDYVEEAMRAEKVAFDIEVESEQITCIGLATEAGKAICIPFWFGASGSLWEEGEERAIWGALRGLLESERPKKIAHNGAYDVEYLKSTVGISCRLHFDTMLAFHVLYAELPKALSFLVSLYTDHPYYKYQRKTDSMDEYFRYNATDACLTYECATCLESELADAGLGGFYDSHVHSLVDPLLSMQQRGVRFDTEARNRLRKQYRYDISVLQHKLEEQVGHPLNVASHP